MTEEVSLAAVVFAGIDKEKMAKLGTLEVSEENVLRQRCAVRFTITIPCAGPELARELRNLLNISGLPHTFDVNFERGSIGFRYIHTTQGQWVVEHCLEDPFRKTHHVVHAIHTEVADAIYILNELMSWLDHQSSAQLATVTPIRKD